MTAHPGSRHYVPGYSFEPNTPCYCGSNSAFSHCCGPQRSAGKVPAGICVVNNFVDPTQLAALMTACEQGSYQWLDVNDDALSTPDKRLTFRDEQRITQSVDIGDKQADLVELCLQASKVIAQRANVKIASFEQPQILRYSEGGCYKPHVDAENFDAAQNAWYRSVDRDVSILIYLNDDYVGGGIKFNYLDYTHQPKAGDLVFFPSNHVFMHESIAIDEGVKYAVVCWALQVGTQRLK